MIPSHSFFNIQLNQIVNSIKSEMSSLKEGSKFAIPITFGNGHAQIFVAPFQNMHTTYLIVEKKGENFNLYRINRPFIFEKKELSFEDATARIQQMLNIRFPFMDTEKMMQYPFQHEQPQFSDNQVTAEIAGQGDRLNCVVSNLFGMLEALDIIRNEEKETTKLRYQVFRSSLRKYTKLHKHDFLFSPQTGPYSLTDAWKGFKRYIHEPI